VRKPDRFEAVVIVTGIVSMLLLVGLAIGLFLTVLNHQPRAVDQQEMIPQLLDRHP
jgi:hypothetical protein